MKSLLGLACLGLLLSAPIATALDDDDAEFDAKKMVGNWGYDSGTRAGEEVAADRLVGTIKITDSEITLPVGPDAEFVFAYKLDTSKTPVMIDMEIKSGPVPEGKAVGIVKMEDGKLTLCYNPMGGDRPAEFASTADNGAFMFVLKKADD